MMGITPWTGSLMMGSPSLAEFEHQISELIVRRDFSRAAAAAAACRASWPKSSAGWLLGSIVALLAEDPETALALIEARLAEEPRNVQCLLQKSESLLALGRRDEALSTAAQTVGYVGENPAALEALTDFLVQAQEYAQALPLLDRAVAAAPDRAELPAKRAVLHRLLGHLDLARRDYEAVLARSPHDAEALKALAELRTQTPGDNLVSRLEAALQRVDPGSSEAAVLHFGLAKSYEDLGDHPGSWQHVTTANRLERAGLQYDRDTDRAVVDRMILGFDRIEAESRDSTRERPIFVVGLPRTGISLADRIIGSHSQVHPAGELTSLSEAIGITFKRAAPQRRGWLEYAASLPALDGESIAREYLLRAGARRGTRPRFSDRQPVNFYYCPLILRAFPRAHIVHLTRHPLAACHAIFKTRFEGTFPFSCDLEELADFYAGYRRLMTHWHRVLPGRIVEVAYEDLVTVPEPTVRRLLDRLELPFEQACLEAHAGPDATPTGSATEVGGSPERQSLGDVSLGQWRNYERELAPVRARLESAGIALE